MLWKSRLGCLSLANIYSLVLHFTVKNYSGPMSLARNGLAYDDKSFED